MLARLWWKEWRLFGPAGLLMLLGAAGVQWFYLTSAGKAAMDGSATTFALMWAVIYAYAAGAAAFAAERESRTLGFLDALPVSRGTLWLGKSSFAGASTLALALLLIALGALGTEHRDEQNQRLNLLMIAGMFAVLLLEGLAWGLFWSSVLGNPLAAGALAVASAGAVWMLSNLNLGHSPQGDGLHAPIRLAVAGLALAASALAITSKRPVFRLPAVVRPDRAAGVMTIRRASVTRSLAWQAWREGYTTLLLGLFLTLIVPTLVLVSGHSGDLEGFGVLLVTLAALMLGVGVFGLESTTGTRAFLHNHGVSPGAAWGRRMLVWVPAIATLGSLLLAFTVAQILRIGPPTGGRAPLIILLVAWLLDAFGVGLICGMAIRRRITSALVAIMALIALAPIQMAAAAAELAPAWATLVTPFILLAASRAWAGDWLADRGGYRSYGRLALLVAVPLFLEADAYVAYRAWSVPDAGPIAGSAPAPAVPPVEDAARAYRKAAELIASDGPDAVASQSLIEEGIADPKAAPDFAWLDRDGPALEAARKAAAMPRISVPAPRRIGSGLGSPDELGSGPAGFLIDDTQKLSRLLAIEARWRQSEGDLAGAWDDILAQLRMSVHLSSSRPEITLMTRATWIHHQAIGLAIDWAVDPKQAPGLIRRALDDVRALPVPATLTRAIPAESAQADQLLKLPADDLGDAIYGLRKEQTSAVERMAFALFAAPPWERERARRVCHRIFLGQLKATGQEPWERDPSWVYSAQKPGPEGMGTPLARMLMPAIEGFIAPIDRELENRRALEIALALRSWQLGHGGEYPATLEALVPSVLPRLPLDPYSGRPFGYVQSKGQAVQPPIRGDMPKVSEKPKPTRPGQWLLYSVGPDGRDDGAARSFDMSSRGGPGDLIIPLP